jgi:hypothetical protein
VGIINIFMPLIKLFYLFWNNLTQIQFLSVVDSIVPMQSNRRYKSDIKRIQNNVKFDKETKYKYFRIFRRRLRYLNFKNIDRSSHWRVRNYIKQLKDIIKCLWGRKNRAFSKLICKKRHSKSNINPQKVLEYQRMI